MNTGHPKREKLEISAERTARRILLSTIAYGTYHKRLYDGYTLTECRTDFRRMVEQYRRSIITEVSK